MKYDTAVKFYKTNVAIAQAAEVSEQAVSQWKAKGVVPLKSANRLQIRSAGGCMVEPEVYERKAGKHADSRAPVPGRSGRLA